MNLTVATNDSPAHAYVRLLLRLHDLIASSKGDDAAADTVRDQMDAPWCALTAAEQERVGGLSEDLYALAEHNPRSVAMPADERQRWAQEFKAAFDASDWGRALVLLRRPPDDVPPNHVAYFQADCWEHLGCPEVALRFMRSATRLDPVHAVTVLTISIPQQTG